MTQFIFVQPYIFTLFYTQTDTKEYIDTVKYNTQKVAFESIRSFGKYNFYLPEAMYEENVAYIVPSNFQYNIEIFKATHFGNYIVLENKDKYRGEK